MNPTTPAPVPIQRVVTVETPASEPSQGLVESPPQPPPQKPKNSKVLVLLIFIIILALVGITSFIVGSKSISQTSPTPVASLSPTPTMEPSPSLSPSPQTGIQEPTPTPTPVSETKVITSTPTLDGFESSNGSGNTTVDIRVGRNTFAVSRGFVSFDLTSIPNTAAIESAALRIFQTHISGDPQTSGVSIKIDHMDYGPVLDGNDYPLAPLQTNLATLTSNNEVEWKEVLVTEAVQNDIKTSRVRSQYRLRFAQETIGGTTGGDFSHFESGENFVGTGNIPQLIIKYH